MKSSEIVLIFYLHFTWLYGSTHLQRILKKFPFWKYSNWFSFEVSKLTSLWNKLNLSLTYWFIKERLVFCTCYGPNKWLKCHLDKIQTTLSDDNNCYRDNIGKNLFLSSLKMHYFRDSLPKLVLTPQKKTSCHNLFKHFWW